MFFFALYLILAIASIILIYLIIERRKYVNLINKIPGPPTLPVIGNLLDLSCNSGRYTICFKLILNLPAVLLYLIDQLWLNLRKFSKKYYPIYKVWSVYMPAVFLITPEDTEILISNMKHTQKSLLYAALIPWLGTGLLISDGQKWKLRRKLLTPAFHFNVLKQFTQIFVHHGDELIEQLRGECQKPYTDVISFITKFTLNSVCETAMGTQLQSEDKKHDEYRNAINKMGELVVHRVISPWLYNPILYSLSTTNRQSNKLANILHKFSKNVIRIRKSQFNGITDDDFNDSISSKKKLAMLDLLISAQNSGVPIDEEGIREEVDTFMFEGHDTTAMSICFTLMLLACHPKVQEKVVAELNEVLYENSESTLFEKMKDLKYLEMVLKESLRLFPSVPLISRIASETFTTHSGYVIPEGCTVNVLIYDLHRNPDIYPDPHKFDPERFSPQNCIKRHPFAYIPFSAGPRNCIGQKFAMLELKIVIAKILMNFKLTPIDSSDEIELVTDIIIRTNNGIKLKFETRM